MICILGEMHGYCGGGLGDTRHMPLPRMFAIALIAFGLCLLALSHYHYGLAAQQGQLFGSVPLLFAALLLGRKGLWTTATGYFVILLIGIWADLRPDIAGAATRGEAFTNLLQSAMGCILTGLILDRLLLKSEISRQRSHDLALLYRHLETETREKERSQAQLIHSQRMDSLGKLAANVAHDFNNLLCVILGYATQSDYADSVQERLDGITSATQRGKHLTDRLMTLARAAPQTQDTFDANAALRELQPMIESMLGKRILVTMALCQQPAWIHMDLAEFEAAVLNIAKNAGDAMAGDGCFRIEGRIADDTVVLRFSDDGCGMRKEVAARVFEPFFTTKPARQGTGIGLAVVYRAMLESDGSIEVDSAPGQGTCFTLRLPLRETSGTTTGRSPA